MSAVSVIIPCFNHAAYLEQALASVRAQSRVPDEIIVVDDGSSDGSGAIAARFAPQVRLVTQMNQGIGAARNTGLAAARGTVIAFLDADDLWPAESLKLRLDRLDAAPAVDCVFGKIEHFLSPEVDPVTAAGLHCPPGQTAARFAGAMVVRRSVFERIGLFNPDLRVGETMDWIARLSEAAIPTAAIDALVMRRRIHGANTVIRERMSQSDYLRVLKASLARKAASKNAN
jgi:glycosyltransferase involved in cell wall biosynthesis